MPDEPSSVPADRSDSALEDVVASAQRVRVHPEANWGVESPPKMIRPSARFISVGVVALALLALVPVLFILLRPSSVSVSVDDDAYRTLDAYSRAVASGGSLEENLSPAQRADLSAARRVERSDGPYLTLQGVDRCWAVPLAPAASPAAPVALDDAFCR